MAKKKLMQPAPEGKGWTTEEANFAEITYKRTLFLMQVCDFPVIPNEYADSMWHQHILDTHQYPVDCIRVFGKFIHHYPFFGLRSTQDAEALTEASVKTREAYEARYGEPYARPDGTSLSCQACAWIDIAPDL